MYSLTSYFTVEYMVMLLPACVLLYALLPQKLRRYDLLFFSFVFFWAVSGKLIACLLYSAAVIYASGLLLDRLQEQCTALTASCEKKERRQIRERFRKKQQRVLAAGILLNLGLLLVLKYTPFFSDNLNAVLRAAHTGRSVPRPSWALPIGISFYTMQAMSYLIDVYRGTVQADRNPLRLALYLSFFPQLMEGPICRYTDTAQRLWEAPKIRWDNFTMGMQRILYGIMKKTVVADRLNMFIENVFTPGQTYDGFVTAAAMAAYTVQLYMDFSGTMDVVIGSAQIFGVTLPENFRRPFFSRTISEFWTRWHITLGTWFRDYLFYPLSMSGPLKRLTSRARRKLGTHYGPLCSGAIALFCVWFCNGLWHGAGWHYIAFGMYHFVLILMGSILDPPSAALAAKLHVNRNSVPWRCMQIIRTVLLVFVGELIFRAESLSLAAGMLRTMFTGFTLQTLRDGTFFTLGADRCDYMITAAALVIVLVIGILQEKGVRIRESIAARPLVVRYAVFLALILFIVIFGAYGQGYIPVNPIYAEF